MREGLASDIDGTLCFPDLKKMDLEAIQEFQKEGYLFGLCSGRSQRGVLDLFPKNISPDFYIAATGSIIYNKNKEIIYEKTIDFKTVEKLYQSYKNQSIIVFVTDSDYIYKTDFEGFEDFDREEVKVIKDLNEIKNHKFYGVSLVLESEEIASQLCQELNKLFQGIKGFQNRDSIDIVHIECSKGKAILKIKELFHIEKISAIGDSFNDISMLKAADQSFTFHNALIEADIRVDSVANAIHTIMKK